jgi:hypothetical protein
MTAKRGRKRFIVSVGQFIYFLFIYFIVIEQDKFYRLKPQVNYYKLTKQMKNGPKT